MKYEIKEIEGKWVIVRPNGKHVNECLWKERKHAEKHLEMLLAMKVEEWGVKDNKGQ